MTDRLREAAQAVVDSWLLRKHTRFVKAMAELNGALAEKVEPVAWLIDWPDEHGLGCYFAQEPSPTGRSTPLYAHPPTTQEPKP